MVGSVGAGSSVVMAVLGYTEVRKFGGDRCFGLHGSSGSLSRRQVVTSTAVLVSRRTLFG